MSPNSMDRSQTRLVQYIYLLYVHCASVDRPKRKEQAQRKSSQKCNVKLLFQCANEKPVTSMFSDHLSIA